MNLRRLFVTALVILLLETLLTAGFYSLAVAQIKSETAGFKVKVSELPPEMVGEQANELLSQIYEWD